MIMSSDKVADLEHKVEKLEHDIAVLKEILTHIKTQFKDFRSKVEGK